MGVLSDLYRNIDRRLGGILPGGSQRDQPTQTETTIAPSSPAPRSDNSPSNNNNNNSSNNNSGSTSSGSSSGSSSRRSSGNQRVDLYYDIDDPTQQYSRPTGDYNAPLDKVKNPITNPENVPVNTNLGTYVPSVRNNRSATEQVDLYYNIDDPNEQYSKPAGDYTGQLSPVNNPSYSLTVPTGIVNTIYEDTPKGRKTIVEEEYITTTYTSSIDPMSVSPNVNQRTENPIYGIGDIGEEYIERTPGSNIYVDTGKVNTATYINQKYRNFVDEAGTFIFGKDSFMNKPVGPITQRVVDFIPIVGGLARGNVVDTAKFFAFAPLMTTGAQNLVSIAPSAEGVSIKGISGSKVGYISSTDVLNIRADLLALGDKQSFTRVSPNRIRDGDTTIYLDANTFRSSGAVKQVTNIPQYEVTPTGPSSNFFFFRDSTTLRQLGTDSGTMISITRPTGGGFGDITNIKSVIAPRSGRTIYFGEVSGTTNLYMNTKPTEFKFVGISQEGKIFDSFVNLRYDPRVSVSSVGSSSVKASKEVYYPDISKTSISYEGTTGSQFVDFRMNFKPTGGGIVLKPYNEIPDFGSVKIQRGNPSAFRTESSSFTFDQGFASSQSISTLSEVTARQTFPDAGAFTNPAALQWAFNTGLLGSTQRSSSFQMVQEEMFIPGGSPSMNLLSQESKFFLPVSETYDQMQVSLPRSGNAGIINTGQMVTPNIIDIPLQIQPQPLPTPQTERTVTLTPNVFTGFGGGFGGDPRILIGGLPDFGDFDAGSLNIGNLAGREQMFKYTPDFQSLVFGIKGKAPPGGINPSPFAERPITQGFSFAFNQGPDFAELLQDTSMRQRRRRR